MGKSTPSAPAAPNPYATAKADASGKIETAVANQQLNAVNQYTPDGSLEYEQVGYWPSSTTGAAGTGISGTSDDPVIAATLGLWSAAGGDTKAPALAGTGTSSNPLIPRMKATTKLSAANQAIYDKNQGMKLNLATMGQDQTARLNTLLSEPVDFGQTAIDDKLEALQRHRLDPRFQRERDQTETALANKGIRIGSPAYAAEMQRLDQSKNDAYNQLALTGRQQAIQEIAAQRNQPLNEITALLNGSQVQQPKFTNTSSGNVANTDLQSGVNSAYSQQMQAYNAAQQQESSMWGGIGSAALSIGSMFLSDERTKENIEQIGQTPDGLGIYNFNYIGDDKPQTGLMAQEVEKIKPHAVAETPGGIKMVDYAAALAPFEKKVKNGGIGFGF